MYEAVTKSVAGNDLYFTGIHRFDLVTSQYASHRKTYASAAEAQKAIDPWNALGNKFTVRAVAG